MTPILKFSLFLFTGLFASNSLFAQDSESKWHTRYTPAIKQAQAENKSLILVFTGSKWIEICKIFESDILDQPEFVDQVSEKYVLLKLEFPKNNRMPEEIGREYQLLKDAYRVHGFPTVLVTDPEGRPFGMNGYQPVSADIYAKTLLAMLKGKEIRDTAFAKAKEQKGLEKAKTLAAGIPDLPGTLGARYYRKEIEEIIANDPRNKTGKTEAFQKQIADVDYATNMQKLAADVQYSKMLELTDAYIRDQNLKGDVLQKALLNKLGVQQKQKNTAGAVQTLLEVVTVNPESHFGKSAQKMLDNLRAQKIQENLEE